MNDLSRANVGLRRFTSVPGVENTIGKRTGLTGTPYKPLDRFSCWLIWSTALAVALGLWRVDGEALLAWGAAGPASVGVACLIAKMFDRDLVTRLIAVGYLAIAFIAFTAYAAGLP